MRRKDPLMAAENFVNAMFDEKLKRINESPLSKATDAHLDTIFMNYLLPLED